MASEQDKGQREAAALFMEVLKRMAPAGQDRSSLAPDDETAFIALMKVIFGGQTHAQAAAGVCTEAQLVARHREFLESQALIEFLLYYYPEYMRRQAKRTGRTGAESDGE